MLQAMTTGHDGSLSTGHANSPRDMLRRLETMVLMTGYQMPLRAIREQIASAVDLIVHTARLKDGSRKIVNITEVYGIEDDEILTQDIFAFEQTGYRRTARSIGELQPTGIRPTFMPPVRAQRRRAAAGRVRHPAGGPAKPIRRPLKSRWGARTSAAASSRRRCRSAAARPSTAGGMVYVSSIGPVDPETGADRQRRDQGADPPVHGEPQGEARGGRQLARQGRLGELVAPRRRATSTPSTRSGSAGSRATRRSASATLMPPLQRRAGFRVSLGVIATL